MSINSLFPLQPRFPSYSRTTTYDFMLKPFPDNFDIYCDLCGITLKEWQRQECINLIQMDYLLNWGRGMSKTLLLSLVTVFDGLCGLPTAYLVPRTDELVQPIKYFNANPFVDPNPYKRDGDKTVLREKARWFRVLGKDMIKIGNIDDKGFNVSSGRFSRVRLDECALLMYYKQELELYNKSRGMLRAMPYPRFSAASTPLIGSHFVTIKEERETTAPHTMSWRNFENTPDNFLTDTKEKRETLLKEREDAKRMGILFAWKTENLAIPQTASGAAFKNIIVEDLASFPSQIHNRVGFDFHGYQQGHVWVATYYNNAMSPEDIWIIAEGAETYDEQATADESMNFLEDNPFFHHVHLVGESGGMINDPYIKAGRKWGMNAVSINGQEKHDLEANILNYRVHIDKIRCPNTFDDLSNAQWKDPNKFILLKEASGANFRNHYLDAFANQLPMFAKGPGFYIPNKKLRVKSFEEQDRMAHSIRI